MISEAERGLSVRTSATVGDLLEQWFDFAARDFSPKTVKETRGFIDRNLLSALGTVPLSKLKAGDLDRFYRKLSVDGESRSGPLAPGTVRRIHGILRRALGQGLKWGWIGVNPAVATTPPRVPQPDINPPSCAEVARLLRRAAATSPELACFLMLWAATGARRSEIVALRWSDVDLPNRTVAISRGVVTGPDGLVEKDTKSHAARRIALDESAVVVLADHAAGDRAQPSRDRCSGASQLFEIAGERFDVVTGNGEQSGVTIMAPLGELAEIERVRIACQARVAAQETGQGSEFGIGEHVIGKQRHCRGLSHQGSFQDRSEPQRPTPDETILNQVNPKP